MAIHYLKDNLLEAKADALVNTVNCVGVMGKGIALQFKQAFPKNFDAYLKACKAHQIHPGHMFVFNTTTQGKPRLIINFPTKTHWKAKSHLDYIKDGLKDLLRVIHEHQITSIAIPPLGCGNGGLQWDKVKLLIENAMAEVPKVEVFIYPPQEAPCVDKMIVGTSYPRMTLARAMFIKLIEQYCLPGYRLSLLEIQKLAYFLQEVGEESLRLKFVKHKYGPYANDLNHVLQRIEGHFIRGYGDRDKSAEIQILGQAINEANHFLLENDQSKERLNRVKELIEGFETPYGLELLSSVHWVVKHENAATLTDVINCVHSWNERKRQIMQSKHIEKALKRLKETLV